MKAKIIKETLKRSQFPLVLLLAGVLAVSASWAASQYKCWVLAMSWCVVPGTPCSVQGHGDGTISDPDFTWQCMEGSPGWSECGQKGTNTVVCNYACRIDGINYWQQTRTPEYELKGTSCPAPTY